MVVGFPATLYYFTYFPFWKAFFNSLGVELVLSPKTNKAILDSGAKETVSDACVPIKIAHGHALALKGKVDQVFIPRLVSVDHYTTFCPKFLGLPDMIRYAIPGLPEMIDTRIDLKRGPLELVRVCLELGERLGAGKGKSLRAYLRARQIHGRYLQLQLQGYLPLEAMEKSLAAGQKFPVPVKQGDLSLAVVGYPYQVHDAYININLLEKLRSMGVRLYTVEMVPARELRRYRKRLRKNMFWYYSDLVVKSAFYYLDQPDIDGLIHVTAFGCGPDAMVDKVIELEAAGRKPFMSLTIDEHTGEAGIATRVEAFVDMLRIRRQEAK